MHTANIEIENASSGCLQDVKNNGKSLTLRRRKWSWSLIRGSNCKALTRKIFLFWIGFRLWALVADHPQLFKHAVAFESFECSWFENFLFLQTVTAGMAENTRGDIVEMSRYVFFIFMQGYGLLHRLFQGSVGNTRELETSEKRERGVMGTSVERELFLPFQLLPSSPLSVEINSKYSPKSDRERLRMRLQIFFFSSF